MIGFYITKILLISRNVSATKWWYPLSRILLLLSWHYWQWSFYIQSHCFLFLLGFWPLSVFYFTKSALFFSTGSVNNHHIFFNCAGEQCKNSIRCAPYGVFYACFFYSILVLTEYMDGKKTLFLWRIFIWALFFISFYVNSLLLFYSIVLLYIIYKLQEDNHTLISSLLLKRCVMKYGDFIVLPILFWVIKKKFFAPYGLYQTYNQINFSYVKANLLINIINSIKTTLYDPLKQTFLVGAHFPFLFILMLVITTVVFNV